MVTSTKAQQNHVTLINSFTFIEFCETLVKKVCFIVKNRYSVMLYENIFNKII